MSLHVAAVDLYEPSQAVIWLDLLDHYARDPMGGGAGLSEYARANLVCQLKDRHHHEPQRLHRREQRDFHHSAQRHRQRHAHVGPQ